MGASLSLDGESHKRTSLPLLQQQHQQQSLVTYKISFFSVHQRSEVSTQPNKLNSKDWQIPLRIQGHTKCFTFGRMWEEEVIVIKVGKNNQNFNSFLNVKCGLAWQRRSSRHRGPHVYSTALFHDPSLSAYEKDRGQERRPESPQWGWAGLSNFRGRAGLPGVAYPHCGPCISAWWWLAATARQMENSPVSPSAPLQGKSCLQQEKGWKTSPHWLYCN